ncbi:MFS transporter [bacterium]|nr:MFS transporter [bacterium]
MKSRFAIFLIAAFSANLSNELLNMGLIVKIASFGSDPIKQTALVVLVAAVAILLSVVVKNKFQLTQPIVTILLAAGFMLPCVFFKELSPGWLIFLFLRIVFGFMAFAQIMVLLPAFVRQHEMAARNKTLQITTTIATGLGFALAPFVAGGADSMMVYWLNIAALLVSAILLTSLRVPTSAPSLCEATPPILNPKFSATTLILSLTWVVLGVFFVLKVPLLNERIAAAPNEISLFFIVNFGANLLATKILPERYFDRKGSLFFVLSSLFIVLASACFLMSYNKWILLFCFACSGFANGALNLCLYTRVQRVPNVRDREDSFLWYRVIIEVGILLGTLLVMAANLTEHVYSSVAMSALVVGFLIALISWRVRLRVFESEMPVDMEF